MLLSNPDYEDKIRYVAQWYLEYDEEGHGSWREIGLDINKRLSLKCRMKETMVLVRYKLYN